MGPRSQGWQSLGQSGVRKFAAQAEKSHEERLSPEHTRLWTDMHVLPPEILWLWTDISNYGPKRIYYRPISACYGPNYFSDSVISITEDSLVTPTVLSAPRHIRTFLSLNAFNTTDTELKAMAAPANHGAKKPRMAKGIIMTL